MRNPAVGEYRDARLRSRRPRQACSNHRYGGERVLREQKQSRQDSSMSVRRVACRRRGTVSEDGTSEVVDVLIDGRAATFLSRALRIVERQVPEAPTVVVEHVVR